MNGRVYDPVTGRFLSPDNQVQAPENTQSYNRFSYCFNNPLKYTDPTGWLGSNTMNGGGETVGADGLTNSEWIALSIPSPYELDMYLSSLNPNSYASPAFVKEVNLKNELYSGGNSNSHISYHYEAMTGTCWIVSEDYTEWHYKGTYRYYVLMANAAGGGGIPGGEHGNEMLGFTKAVGEGGHLMVHGAEATLENEAKYFAKLGQLSKAAGSEAAVAIAKNVGHGIGFFNVGISVAQGFDHGWSNGDFAKLALSGVVFIPYVGWAYGLADLGTELVTGKSITDRVGETIDGERGGVGEW